MSWAILILSAIFEAVWATALGRSDGFTMVGPTVVFGVGMVISMVGLAIAMTRIPISVAYAVWVGLGAALTVAFAMASGDEPASVAKVIFLAGIIACVIGLKFVRTKPGRNADSVNGTQEEPARSDATVREG
ncbi:DMT family transporter [Actinopolymorpha alba]|uniref:DMT family transporter n=1 Tax=Actinopolymorpha alba TaxID=533267 RepID=UPI00037C397F|nr:multidrug efflux SMR transporter [Actinopolymorpha alba]